MLCPAPADSGPQGWPEKIKGPFAFESGGPGGIGRSAVRVVGKAGPGLCGGATRNLQSRKPPPEGKGWEPVYPSVGGAAGGGGVSFTFLTPVLDLGPICLLFFQECFAPPPVPSRLA